MRHDGPNRDTGQGFPDLNCFLSLLAFPLGPPCRARLVLVRAHALGNMFGRSWVVVVARSQFGSVTKATQYSVTFRELFCSAAGAFFEILECKQQLKRSKIVFFRRLRRAHNVLFLGKSQSTQGVSRFVLSFFSVHVCRSVNTADCCN